jgi:1-deoxy-D-xylulose-5-phosphate reductoisomerase
LQALIPSKPHDLPDLLAIDLQARRLAETQVERLSR